LFDDVAAKVGIDHPANGSFDGTHEAGVANVVLSRKLGECFGFEDTHNRPTSSINYNL
jgi:hypothetical protein